MLPFGKPPLFLPTKEEKNGGFPLLYEWRKMRTFVAMIVT